MGHSAAAELADILGSFSLGTWNFSLSAFATTGLSSQRQVLGQRCVQALGLPDGTREQ
jgi:hypothetical protein